MVPRAGGSASSLSLRGKIDRACSTLLIVALSFGLAGCKYSVPRFPPELAEADTRAVLLAAPVASEEVAAIHLVGARASAEGDGIYIDILVVARDARSVARLLGEARHLVPVSDLYAAEGPAGETIRLELPDVYLGDFARIIPLTNPSFAPGAIAAQTYVVDERSDAAIQTLLAKLPEPHTKVTQLTLLPGLQSLDQGWVFRDYLEREAPAGFRLVLAEPGPKPVVQPRR
jgi:hypothetical protein